jgi:hypothetical protein
VLSAVLVAVVRPWSNSSSGGDGNGAKPSDAATFDASPNFDGEVIFRDDFGRGDLGGSWEPLTGRWSMTDGQLTGVDPQFGQQTVMLDRDLPADIAVRFRTKMSANGVAELMLRVSGGRYVRVYLFGASQGVYIGNGTLAYDGAADGGKTVTEKSYSVEVDTWYTVTTTARGSTYTVEVNGSTVLQYNDTTGTLNATGRMGFTAHATEVRFDDVEIRRS